ASACEIDTLSLHDALPIYPIPDQPWLLLPVQDHSVAEDAAAVAFFLEAVPLLKLPMHLLMFLLHPIGRSKKEVFALPFSPKWRLMLESYLDRKSTRLNSSHV